MVPNFCRMIRENYSGFKITSSTCSDLQILLSDCKWRKLQKEFFVSLCFSCCRCGAQLVDLSSLEEHLSKAHRPNRLKSAQKAKWETEDVRNSYTLSEAIIEQLLQQSCQPEQTSEESVVQQNLPALSPVDKKKRKRKASQSPAKAKRKRKPKKPTLFTNLKRNTEVAEGSSASDNESFEIDSVSKDLLEENEAKYTDSVKENKPAGDSVPEDSIVQEKKRVDSVAKDSILEGHEGIGDSVSGDSKKIAQKEKNVSPKKKKKSAETAASSTPVVRSVKGRPGNPTKRQETNFVPRQTSGRDLNNEEIKSKTCAICKELLPSIKDCFSHYETVHQYVPKSVYDQPPVDRKFEANKAKSDKSSKGTAQY